MSGVLILALTALRLGSTNHTHSGNDIFYQMPRFWTNTGFCPFGSIEHKDMTTTLKSPAIRQQLRHISALPTGAITHIRIHWLLELLQLEQYTQSGVPIYNFDDLDEFLMYLAEDLNLKPVIEFMANPGNVFSTNPNRNGYLWANFSFQITRHYMNLFGSKAVEDWRFETWNEPDLKGYNILNLTVDDYITYADSIRQGLNVAGRRFHFPLRGPAGLFKAKDHHPLCWKILEYCNSVTDIKECPFDILTYHRKGNGTDAKVLIEESSELLKEIHEQFPAIKKLPISNDESDPIAGWSTPREFQEDVRYAAVIISIVIFHWKAKLERNEFKYFESISHDNAFLSYHPFEFSQRTMLAHFRMNQTDPPHSQFIQKPVYAAMGLLAKLAQYATLPEQVVTSNNEKIWSIKTASSANEYVPLYKCWIIIPDDVDSQADIKFTFVHSLPETAGQNESHAFIVETLEQTRTDPAYIWRKMHQKPAYPDAMLRELMRRHQTPRIYRTGQIKTRELSLEFDNLYAPWITMIRICSSLVDVLKRPEYLVVEGVTHNELLLTWREAINSTQCLKSYEIWFRTNDEAKWNHITEGWHLPFPNFQFSPLNSIVNGFYKVRGIDIFERYGPFSDVVEYIEV